MEVTKVQESFHVVTHRVCYSKKKKNHSNANMNLNLGFAIS